MESSDTLFLAFDPARRNLVAPAQDIKLSAHGIAHQLSWRLQEMNKRSRAVALAAVGAVNESSQLADLHEHLRDSPPARKTEKLCRRVTMKALEEAACSLQAIPEWARSVPSRCDRDSDDVSHWLNSGS